MTWFSTKTCVGSATSEAPRGFIGLAERIGPTPKTRSGVIRERWRRRALSATSALRPVLDHQDDRQGDEDANDDPNRAAKGGTGTEADQGGDEVSPVTRHPLHVIGSSRDIPEHWPQPSVSASGPPTDGRHPPARPPGRP